MTETEKKEKQLIRHLSKMLTELSSRIGYCTLYGSYLDYRSGYLLIYYKERFGDNVQIPGHHNEMLEKLLLSLANEVGIVSKDLYEVVSLHCHGGRSDEHEFIDAIYSRYTVDINKQ